MPIVLLRIDDRLIHGQVVEGWLPRLDVDMVVVASDAAASDPVQTALMKMALPPEIGLSVLSVADAPGALAAPQAAARRVLILVPGPEEALALLEHGVAVDRVNVGGLHFTVGKVQLGRALFLSEKDKGALRAIAARGVRLEGRPLPADPEENLASMLGCA
ncbi:MAG: PTS sugar transporter subunit IIB [Elusimicrobia bacterium]|nr:PTS sugar transporter subunit IIB [Elusimicrobiota bacterium]MDE2510356.1 PTS sugar transporter subunit IIB [Elusimicrobiota bacterium]